LVLFQLVHRGETLADLCDHDREQMQRHLEQIEQSERHKDGAGIKDVMTALHELQDTL